MHDDATTPASRLPRGSRRKRADSAGSTEQEKRAFVKRGLGRAQRTKYQELYRREYVQRHGGGKQGEEALRERNRQQQRSLRAVRYLPLLFETADHRYRLWTWEGPSKLFLKSLKEADGMRDLFVPPLHPRVVPYTTDVNRDLRSACKVAAAGIPLQGLSDQERRAYAFLLWNECRRYEYLSALKFNEDPRAEEAPFRLVSQLLVEAVAHPLSFVQFLVDTIRPSVDEYVQEIEASEFPLDRRDPGDQAVLHFREVLTAAQAYLAASGLSRSSTNERSEYQKWFRRQTRATERTEPGLRTSPEATPFPLPAELPVLLDVTDASRRSRGSSQEKPKRGSGGRRSETTSSRYTVKK